MAKQCGFAMALAWLALAAPPAHAQSARLPIAQGVWVPVATACGTASNVFVHGANRFGSLYFYGPNQSMGPADETEALVRIGRGRDGFTVVNEGPLEVAARPGGQAVVRAYSPSQGVQWSDTVRLCPPAALSARLRTAIARLGLAAVPAR